MVRGFHCGDSQRTRFRSLASGGGDEQRIVDENQVVEHHKPFRKPGHQNVGGGDA
jgi:hypothetical protein